MLPDAGIVGQMLTRDPVVIIDVNIDVIAIMDIAAVMVIVIVMMVVVIVVMMMIVMIPVDTAEQGVGCCHTQAVAEAFDEAVGKLLSRRRWQIDGRICGIRPGAVDRGRVVGGNIYHLRIGGFDFDDCRRCRMDYRRGSTFGGAGVRCTGNGGLTGDFLLRRRFQRARLLCQRAQFLY